MIASVCFSSVVDDIIQIVIRVILVLDIGLVY